MTTSKCVYGKVTETNLVHRNSEHLEKKKKNKIKGQKWNAKKQLKKMKNVSGRK